VQDRNKYNRIGEYLGGAWPNVHGLLVQIGKMFNENGIGIVLESRVFMGGIFDLLTLVE